MLQQVMFFVSEEGAGHKVRESCVANVLAQKDVKVVFQTRDAEFVRVMLDPRVQVVPVTNPFELRKNAFGVDVKETLASLADYVPRSKNWVDQMTRSKNVLDSDVLVTDIVEEVGLIGRRTGKPVIATCHFTWHWLLDQLGAEFADVSAYLKGCFTVDRFLYPPFSKNPESFPNRQPIDLIVRQPRPKRGVRTEFGVNATKPVIAIGKSEVNILNCLRHYPRDLGKTGLKFISNSNIGSSFWLIPDGSRFHDYVNAADMVIVKGGYNTIAECLAYGTKIMIVKEKNHPEALENAKLLMQENRAFVCDIDDFIQEPVELIFRALETKTNNSPVENHGQEQACRIILNTSH